MTSGRLLALREVLLGFLPGSKRTAHLDCVHGEVWRAKSGPCRARGPLISRFGQLLFLAAVLLVVAIEPVLNLPKIDLSVSIAALQLER